MSVERLKKARKKAIGTKQTVKAVEKGIALMVYVARDAEEHVVRDLIKLCQEKSVPIEYVESMELLGKACGIEVGSASASILEE